MVNPKEPGSITQNADESKERVAEVSNVSRTINQMQKEVNQQINKTGFDTGDYEKIQEVQNSMLKVLSSLSSTVTEIGRGFGKVAVGTAKAGKDVLTQYSKAISEDISFNKQNVVAMSLARATPLFGYFATKFMQTDVFKTAAAKMRANVSEALGTAAAKFKEGVGGFFEKLKITGQKERPIKTPIKSIPKMQHGGFVERAGLAMVHPAEVVMPIEKVLGKIDESISVTKELAIISRKAQLHTLAKMGTFVQGIEHMEKVGIFKGFLRALSDVQNRYRQPANIRMLRAVLAIQDSLGATIGTWPQVWQKMLVEHPTFRNIMFSLRAMKNIIGTPVELIYQVFKSRGGYKAHLSKAKNPMQATAENIGLVYSEGMWRLDNIAKFTRASAEATRDLSSAFTGKKYGPLEGVSTRMWSLFGLGRKILNMTTKWLPPVLGRVLLGERGWKAGKGIGDFLTEDRTVFLEKLFNGELAGIYGKGSAAETSLTEKGPLKIKGTEPYQFFPHELLEATKTYKAFPVIDNSLIEMQRKQEAIQVEVLDYNKNQLNISEINNTLLEMANKDTNKYRELQEKKESPMLLIAEKAESLVQMSKIEAKKDKKMIGMTKEIAKFTEGSLEVQKKMNFRQKMKSVFNVFSGTFGSVKSLLSLIPTFLPFIFGGGLKKFASRLIGGSVKSGLKGVLSPKIIKSIGSYIAMPFKSLLSKGIISSVLPMMRMLSKLLTGPVGASLIALAGGVALGKAIDKMFGLSEKFQAKLDRLDEKAEAAANAVRAQQATIFEKATKPGFLSNEEQFRAQRMVKMQTTLGGKDRRKNLGMFGRANIVEINAAQQAYMNENIDEYLKYPVDQIRFFREKWSKEGWFTGKLIGQNATKYGKAREASFLKYLQRNATPLSEEELSTMYATYKEKWREKYPVRGTIGAATEKVGEYKDIAIETGIAVADRAMGVIVNSGEVAKDAVSEAVIHSKKVTKAIIDQGEAALKGSKELAGTVTHGFTQSTNNLSSSIQNMTNINNNNNNGTPHLSPFGQSVLRGEVGE